MSKADLKKVLYLNFFTRNFCTYFASIYISVLFFTQIGKEHWAQVPQLVQILSMLFAVLSFFMHKKNFFRVHLILTIIFICSLVTFSFYTSSSLLITLIAAQVFAFDLIGEISINNAMIHIFSPLQYKQMSSNIVSTNIAASIFASLSVVLVQRMGSDYIFVLILVSMVFVHLYFYYLIYTNGFKAYLEIRDELPIESGIQVLRKSMQYILKNQFLLFIFILMIWSQVAKFFADWLYLSSASDIFVDKDQLSIFLSLGHLALMFVMAFFQRTFGKILLSNFAPATLLALNPLLILVLSTIAIIFESFFIGIVLYYMFCLVNKTLHGPTLQISMQSTEKNHRSNVYLVLNFLISMSLLIVTSLMNKFKSEFSYDLLNSCLIFMGILALLVSTQFDGRYFKNIWRTLKNKGGQEDYDGYYPPFENLIEVRNKFHYFNPHYFYMAPYEKKISPDVLDFIESLQLFRGNLLVEEFYDYYNVNNRTSFEKLLLIVNTYLFSSTIDLYKTATNEHQKLLQSSNFDDVKKAIQILNLVDVPEFTFKLHELAQNSNISVQTYAQRALERKKRLLRSRFEQSKAHNLLMIFGELNWDFLDNRLKEKFCTILERPYTKELNHLAELLALKSMIISKKWLIECFDEVNMKFRLGDLIQGYLACELKQRNELQVALHRIQPRKSERSQMIKNLQEHFVKLDLERMSDDERLSILFLVEWVHIDNSEYNFLLRSFENYSNYSYEDKRVWNDFHLEFLKKTKFKKYNKALLGQA